MSNFVDPYFDDSIGTLRNLLGAKSPEELHELEPQIVFANELELESINIPHTNDLTELLAIHAQLFKGVYDWSGLVRTVDIKKSDNGAEYFLIVSKIADASSYVFGELAKEQYLKGLSLCAFVERLAYFYDQLNYIHPFREGNAVRNESFGYESHMMLAMKLTGMKLLVMKTTRLRGLRPKNLIYQHWKQCSQR